MSRKIVFPAVALLLVLIASLLYRTQFDGSEEPRQIHLTGNIELQEVRVAFQRPGRIVELAINEGELVSEGAVLARLDTEELQRQREAAEAELEGARSRLAELDALLRFQRENTNVQIELRQTELRQAEVQLEELETGSRRQDVGQARAALHRAEAELRRAEADWDRAQILYRNSDISTAQYDSARSVFESTQALVEQARQQLSLVLEGPRQENLDLARVHLERAQVALRQAETLRLEVRRNEQARHTVQADIVRARANLALVDSRLDETRVVAPLDGVILSKTAEEGEVVAAGAVIATLGDLTRTWVRAYLSETDLGRVRLGDAVRVTTDSFPNKTYSGRVSFIASDAEFTPRQIQTAEERVRLVYRIKVDIPNPDYELKQNMPVDARVVLADSGENTGGSANALPLQSAAFGCFAAR